MSWQFKAKLRPIGYRSELLRSRPLWFFLAASLLVAGVCFSLYSSRWRAGDRVYRIGWHEDPPFQERGPDGAPTGLAIELVRDGARRSGIRLQWVWTSTLSEVALRTNQVDLWPLITDTPERKRFIHISDVYMQHENTFLVHADSGYYQVPDLARARISYLDLPLKRHLLRAVLPRAQLLARPSLEDAIKAACLRQADAAFLEEYSAVSILLSGAPCPSQPLKLLSAPGLRIGLGVGSTFATAAVADQIREQIGQIPESLLSALVSRWGYFPPQNLDSIRAMLKEGRRERQLRRAVILFASLFILTLFAILRILFQRNRIRKLQAQAALRESDARFRSMADAAPVMIWLAGPDQGRTFFNRGWLSYTGRSMEQELGNGWTSAVNVRDLTPCLETYSFSFAARRDFSMEYRLRRADGEYRWLLDNGVPNFDSHGDFIGYVGTCTDISDIKYAHEENLARQKLESVGRLASGIAHDFNNLLGAVLAHAELSLEELDEGARPYQPLQKIREVAIRGAEIVRQLMLYAGQGSITLEPVDISRVVGDTVELLKLSITKDAVLETDLPEDLPAVRANTAQIQQIVMNLVTNSSEAIGKHIGVIRIATAAVGECVRLQISDTGAGIPPEAQGKIFDPFFTTKLGGRGLGLAVVQGIVRSLDGNIRVLSALGRGTQFEILFRATNETPKAVGSRLSGTRREVEIRGSVILVVEDEEALRQAQARMLEKQGFSVIQAGDGSAALDVIRTSPESIDLMLLDVTLPGASSQEVLAEANRVRPEMVTILTSAYTWDRVAASFEAGVSGHFIRKPYQLREVTDMIQEALSAKSPVLRPLA